MLDVQAYGAELTKVGVDALNVGDDVKFVIGFDDRKKKNRAENVTGGTGAKGRGKGSLSTHAPAS